MNGIRPHIVPALLVAAATVALSVATAKAQTPAPAVTDEQVDAAVDRAVKWLWTEQGPDGIWPHRLGPPDARGIQSSVTGSRWPPGEHTMAVLALEYAGTPLTDEKFKKALKLLLEMNLEYNYMISIRVVTLAHLYQRAGNDLKPSLRTAMKKDVDQLVKNQGAIGGWRYTTPPNPARAIDFSNTQLCVLALSEAAKCGIEIPQEAMLRAHKRFIEDQKEDGGWNYGCYAYGNEAEKRAEKSYGNMTAACTASLFLTNEFLTGGLGCPCRGNRSTRGQDIVGDSIERGIAWLNKEFKPDASPYGYHYFYWIYQAERVGIATGYRYFGAHDWYREIAAFLLTKQKPDGSFGDTVDTSFAILFLVKGRGPILYNKLQHPGDWDAHHFDLPNLVKHVGQAKEQNVLWQVLQAQTPVDLWHDAPVLYALAEKPFTVDAELRKKLRAFTDTGGTILFEASCGAPEGQAFWKKLITELWPEWELKRADKDHPLWAADVEMRGQAPTLLHIDDGIRSIIFFSPADLSCSWHSMAVTRSRPLFDLGLNLPAYASDKARLRSRLGGSLVRPGRGLEGQTPKAGPTANLTLAHLKHGGDYYLGRNYGALPMLSEFLKVNAGLTVELRQDVDPAEPDALKDCQVLWINGRKGVALSDAARDALKARLEAGAFLVAESVMGDQRFTDDFTKLAAEMALDLKPLAAGDPLLTGKLGAAAGYDLSAKVRFSRALELQRVGKDSAALTGLYLPAPSPGATPRLVGVLSPYDILYSLTGAPAYGRLGYEPNWAMALATNLVLWKTAN